jgi:DNA/RNA endonuclease YhcR with UshA esterase domain
MSSKNFPKINIGDLIKIQGEVTEYQGKKRITIHNSTDIEILANKFPPVPIRINCDQKADFYARLVTVSGRISKISGQTIYINDGRGELKIIISSKAIFKRPTMKKNDWVVISGIIDYSNANYVLRPRFSQDIQVKSTGTANSTKSTSQSKTSQSLENVLGVSTANAQSNDIQTGGDQRGSNRNQSSLIAIIMIIAGLTLGIVLTVFKLRRKFAKNHF